MLDRTTPAWAAALRAQLPTLPDPVPDCWRFEGLSLDGLSALIDDGAADPDERQNSAPSLWELTELAPPDATFDGYVVGPGRPDARVSVDTVVSPAGDRFPLDWVRNPCDA